MSAAIPDVTTPRKPNRLYLYVLIGVVIGGLVGWQWPDIGVRLEPVSKGFMNLIKMMISPIIFCTVVLGIAGMSDMRSLGRVGAKALIYFEIVSTLALIIGLIVANTLTPGASFNPSEHPVSPEQAADVARYVESGKHLSAVDHVLKIIPKTFIDAFTGNGDLLQVLLIAILFGVALAAMGERGRAVHAFLDGANLALFGVMNMIMKLAPIGAGAAMAFTVGQYGVGSLKSLLFLMGSFYLTCGIFICVVLGLIAYLTGFSLFRFLLYIKDEILTVLGTSSSESAIVPLMNKLERLGCSKKVVGVVVPAGYSFNLDGTNIYLTLAALFVAQALKIDLTLFQQLTILGVAMLTSKGAAGVTGSGFITLSATLAVVPSIPPEAIAMIFGIDRFMSEARAVTNHIGNGVAAVVMAKWEGELDREKLKAELGG